MITLLLFAELAERLNTKEMQIDASGKTLKEVKEMVKEQHEGIAPVIDQSMIAVNEEYAEDTEILKDGDVIAFIPPVSGG
ncbi:molybdopterin converting factor subunit 1 [Alkalihalophilus pseudofirmus]|uniref:Molybdopterin synthase sulfur carrier subunit n=2 Tax=Alkalihalophilus pseudofirmus TaxID=79885 RepID=A0AAJ2NNZ1_ALKPS|nr:molybdopterin converting factor subunit 1 [Alkalihalophilus pseudofirmus]MDV2885791.1 molybdopterin converting factor subunit 1 [Alkalihalophilus pseudofirmus]